MNGKRMKLREHLRIIGVIALKDIGDALRNKQMISMLISTLFVVVAYRYLPLLDKPSALRVWIYDPGQSVVTQELENSLALNVRTTETESQMKELVGESQLPELGLVFPVDLDARLESGTPPVLQGYIMNWVSEQDIQETLSLVEDELQLVLGRDDPIRVQPNAVYAEPETLGIGFLAAIVFIIAITMLGILMTPNLIMAETSEKTIEVLLVSPATGVHVAVGKALAALFYVMVCCGIACAFYAFLIVHWGLLILTSLLLALFMVAIGLFLGAFLENHQQLIMLSWLFFFPLLVPIFLVGLEPLVPPALFSIIQWVPTVAMSRVFRLSFAHSFQFQDLWIPYSLTLGLTVIVLLVVSWKLQREQV